MSLEHTLEEIAKLERIEQLDLPATLFTQASPKLLQQYRQRIPSSCGSIASVSSWKKSMKFADILMPSVGPYLQRTAGCVGRRLSIPS